MNIRVVYFVLATASFPALAQYRADWNSRNFYEQLHWCRSSIVFPAAADYEKKAVSNGATVEGARSDAISIIPLSDAIASPSCLCAVNELAKDISYASFVADKKKIAGYLQLDKCQEAAKDAMKSMSKERASSLRLK